MDYQNTDIPKPYQYEITCFARIVNRESHPDDCIFFGPHLVNELLKYEFPNKRISRPDAIRFEKNPNQWRLTDLFEFKSGKKRRKPLSKLSRFSSLLEEMREEPDFLPDLLRHGLGKSVDIPERILIPPDDQITVTFVTPKFSGVIVSLNNAPKFTIAHLQITTDIN